MTAKPTHRRQPPYYPASIPTHSQIASPEDEMWTMLCVSPTVIAVVACFQGHDQ
jgi:hypothetical protein